MRNAGRVTSRVRRRSSPAQLFSTYLYQDGPRYWYSTQPTVTKLADDRAEEFKRDPDRVVDEIKERLDADLRAKGAFQRIHLFPVSGADVRDDITVGLVVLGPDHPYTKIRSGKAVPSGERHSRIARKRPKAISQYATFFGCGQYATTGSR